MVSATLPNPTHPVKLTDGTNELGLMLCGPRGENDILAIDRAPFSRTGLKISSKEIEYADEELPFTSSHQDDFSGGRGAEKFEADKTRFADSYRCETRFPNVVFPGAQEKYCTGIGETLFAENWFTDAGRETTVKTVWPPTYFACKFVASATGDVRTATVMLETLESSGLADDFKAEIWSHDAVNDEPLATLGGVMWILHASAKHGTFSYVNRKSGATAGVVSGTTYWLVLIGTWNVVYDGDTSKTGNLKTSINSGVDWTALPGNLYYRLQVTTGDFTGSFFTYKGGYYCVADGKLYISGDRGVADASASTTLVDATKSGTTIPWVADEFIGAVCYIFRGTGSGQYRTITDNTTTVLTVSPAWDTTPDVTSEYVILGAEKWRQVLSATLTAGLDNPAPAGELLYFTVAGAVNYYNCYKSYLNVYTERTAAQTLTADKLLATYDSGSRRWYLWGADDSERYHGVALWRMSVPPLYADLFADKGTVYTFNSPMDDYVNSNVTVSRSSTVDTGTIIRANASFTTGLLVSKNIAAINLTKGRYFEFPIASDVATSGTNDLYLVWCSDELAPNSYVSPAVSGRQRPPDMVYERDSTPTYTDLAAARDGRLTGSTVTIVNTDSILIGSTRPFSAVYINMGGTVNDVASALSATYMSASNGIFTALSNVTDGTASPAGTPLAQDGVLAFTAPADWQPFDINGETLYWISLYYATNLKASIIILEMTVWLAASTVAIPDLVANEWAWVRTANSTFLSRPFPDDEAIVSIGLYRATNLGDQYIQMRDSILVTNPTAEYISVQAKSRITNMISYGQETTNPFLVTEGELFEVQTQNDNAVVKVPLDELATLATPDMGQGVCTNDVYLYFSMGQRIQRYHEGLLENIGPDQDNGLPEGREGNVTQLLSLPGGSIAAVVQGEHHYSVLVRKSGWHEIYRTPICTNDDGSTRSTSVIKIGGIGIQDIPGIGPRMWIVEGDSIIYIDFALSENEAGENFVYGSSVTTPWISMGFLDVSKVLMIMKLYTENLSTTDSNILAFYQLETGEIDSIRTSWTEIDSVYTTSPFQNGTIDTSYAVYARRVRFKFYFRNSLYNVVMKLRAWILSAILSLDVRHMYTIRVRLDDDQQDLTGVSSRTTRAETIQARLDAWAATPPTVLTMESLYSGMTNKKVIVLPFPFKPFSVRTGPGPDAKEALVANIQVLEVA